MVLLRKARNEGMREDIWRITAGWGKVELRQHNTVGITNMEAEDHAQTEIDLSLACWAVLGAFFSADVDCVGWRSSISIVSDITEPVRIAFPWEQKNLSLLQARVPCEVSYQSLMYLPLHLLQVPLLHARSYRNLATLSPYHDAPHVPGVSVILPDDCAVDQAIMVRLLPHTSSPLTRPGSSYTGMDPVVPSSKTSTFSVLLRPSTARAI